MNWRSGSWTESRCWTPGSLGARARTSMRLRCGVSSPSQWSHLLVVGDHDRVLHVRLGGAKAELDEPDLGVLDPRETAGLGDRPVAQDHTLEKLRRVDEPPRLLHDVDVT